MEVQSESKESDLNNESSFKAETLEKERAQNQSKTDDQQTSLKADLTHFQGSLTALTDVSK
jgi:hypothetical protein